MTQKLFIFSNEHIQIGAYAKDKTEAKERLNKVAAHVLTLTHNIEPQQINPDFKNMISIKINEL